MKKGGVRCCMCKRSNNPTHNVPKDYQGHVEAPVGHFWSQKCCTTCYKKAKNMDLKIQTVDERAIPVVSGRNYRIQIMTNDRLYAVYRGYCLAKNIEPVSKTTFVYKFLKVQNIHRSKDETLCQYCLELKNLEEKGELTQDEQKKKRENEEHKTKWYQQSSAYKNIKLKVSRGELMNEILVLHDFTQIKVQGTFFQDLIVCFYSYDANEKDGLKRDYYHYVGSSSYTKNDVSFVVAVWKEMLRKGLFKNCQKIYIFSDGGPKHFKITSTMSFFASFQKFSGIKILYNFFESNHGHSVCDAAASQAKKKLNEVQRNDEERISTPKRITEVINLIKNHGAEIVPESNIDLEKFSTFNGIRSYYKFTFSDDVVLGFVNTESLNSSKQWKLSPFQFFQNEELELELELEIAQEINNE